MPGRRLCVDERVEIGLLAVAGTPLGEIARLLGRSASTISRELARNGGVAGYRPIAAQERADRLMRRPRLRRLQRDPALAERIAELLDRRWSPAGIAAYLAAAATPISHETIYRELYRPDSVLGQRWKQLVRPRPSQRRRRRTRTGVDRQPLGSFVLVTARTADPRLEPGHWEGDLLVGAGNRSATVVICERTTRRLLLGALRSQTANEVCEVVSRLLADIPTPLRKSLCWDQGRELARWPAITAHLDGMPVYFCHPRSPWEKPLAENTCGLLRRWLPRKADLYQPQPHLDAIAHTLNTMPRRSLNWTNPHLAWQDLVATTG